MNTAGETPMSGGGARFHVSLQGALPFILARAP
jgi:hypothetical protein